VLYLLPYWNLVLTDTLDTMNQMFAIFNTLTNLWSKAKFKSYAFYLKASVWDKYCQDYGSQKNISVFKRPLRSLKKHSSHFKQMEALEFLLYSYPFLQNALKPVYLNHHMLLVRTLTLLFNGPLQCEKVESIEKNLLEYVKEFQVCIYLQLICSPD
jgi:hypothetical protein